MKKTADEIMATYSEEDIRETAKGYFSYGLGQTLKNADNRSKIFALRHIKYWSDKFKAVAPSNDRTKTLHKMIDMRIAETRNTPGCKTISCKAACANCCRTLVHVTQDEARLLATRVHNGVKIDEAKLAQQASFDHDPGTWFKLPKAEGTCVFLGEDNNCRVYDNRPASCRTYLVTTSPDLCAPDENGNPTEVEYFNIVEAEMLSTIAARISPQGNLAPMLIEALKEMR